jgi:hypothetical protein
VRRNAVDERAATLGGLSRSAELASATRRRAEQVRQAEQRRAEDVAAGERARLEQGLATAGDLSRTADFARGAAQRIAARAADERGARDRELAERAAEQRARAALASADSERQALDQHRDRWERDGQRLAERTAEEEALDHFNARRSR